MKSDKKTSDHDAFREAMADVRPLRRADRIESLRSTWIRRIQQEMG